VRDSAVVSQAEKSAEDMASQLRTVYVVSQAQTRGKTWWGYTDVVVTDAESSAGWISDVFSSRQPPSRASEPLYRRTSTALSDASDLVTDMRIAVRSHDEAAMARLRPEIAKAADQMEALAESLR
jgi:hypothetical protein